MDPWQKSSGRFRAFKFLEKKPIESTMEAARQMLVSRPEIVKTFGLAYAFEVIVVFCHCSRVHEEIDANLAENLAENLRKEQIFEPVETTEGGDVDQRRADHQSVKRGGWVQSCKQEDHQRPDRVTVQKQRFLETDCVDHSCEVGNEHVKSFVARRAFGETEAGKVKKMDREVLFGELLGKVKKVYRGQPSVDEYHICKGLLVGNEGGVVKPVAGLLVDEKLSNDRERLFDESSVEVLDTSVAFAHEFRAR